MRQAASTVKVGERCRRAHRDALGESHTCRPGSSGTSFDARVKPTGQHRRCPPPTSPARIGHLRAPLSARRSGRLADRPPASAGQRTHDRTGSAPRSCRAIVRFRAGGQLGHGTRGLSRRRTDVAPAGVQPLRGVPQHGGVADRVDPPLAGLCPGRQTNRVLSTRFRHAGQGIASSRAVASQVPRAAPGSTSSGWKPEGRSGNFSCGFHRQRRARTGDCQQPARWPGRLCRRPSGPDRAESRPRCQPSRQAGP